MSGAVRDRLNKDESSLGMRLIYGEESEALWKQLNGGLDNQDMAPLVSPYGQAQQPGVPAYDQTPQAGTQLSYSQNGPQID